MSIPDADKGKVDSSPCTNCATVQDEIKPVLPDNVLPDAPSSTSIAGQPLLVWSLTEPADQPNRASRVAVWDKKMWAANIFLAGATIFDIETTHQGIAHHMCVERNADLGNKPSRGELYFGNVQEFAPVVVLGGFAALGGRAAHLPVWAWKALGYIGPTYGSAIHLRGGIHWYTRCW